LGPRVVKWLVIIVECSDPEDSESEIRVGFVTYSNVLHFYNLKVCKICGLFFSLC